MTVPQQTCAGSGEEKHQTKYQQNVECEHT